MEENLIQVYGLITPILEKIKKELIPSTAMQIDESRFRVMREMVQKQVLTFIP